jgi:hypothetical protein
MHRLAVPRSRAIGDLASDIPWERVRITSDMMRELFGKTVFEVFPVVQFYDHTKRPNRRDLPANYTLTFSLAEGHDERAVV